MNLTLNSHKSSLKKSVKLGKLLADMKTSLPEEHAGIEITGLAVDSRRVEPGDLFFAVPGFVTDGAKYIAEAVSLGARAVITRSADIAIENVAVIKCDEIRKIMSGIAARFYDCPSKALRVVGITGTNGKTTICYLINHIIKSFGETWGQLGTVEYFTGGNTIKAVNTTPESIDLQRFLAEIRETNLKGCVMEVSSHGLDQHRCDHIEFSAGIFTNLTQDHLDYHPDLESYFKAKAILFTDLLKKDAIAVINADDPFGERLAGLCHVKALSFSVAGAGGKTADIIMTDEGYENSRRYFEISYQGETIRGDMPLIGRFNLANAAASVAAIVGLGYDFSRAVKALSNAPQVPGRVERVKAGQPFEIIIDYAHTPDALKNLLTGVDTGGRKILVFGCGGDRDKTKRPVMGKIAIDHADYVVVTSDNPRTENPGKIINDIIKGIPKGARYVVIEKRDEAIKHALDNAGKNDLVIIAGKGHEDYQIVGGTRHYFSDPDVVKRYLRKMGYEGS